MPDRSDHGVRGARTEYEPFEQRITRQAIGSVDTGAGGFAGGIEPRNRRAPIEIGFDATHDIVRSRAHRNPVSGQIEPGLFARVGDRRESAPHVVVIQMRHREVYRGIRTFDLANNRTRNQIA